MEKAKNGRLGNDARKLKQEIYKLRRHVKSLDESARKLQLKKLTRRQAKETAMEYIEKILTPIQFEVVKCLLLNNQRRSRGRRYSKKLKIICLGLYLFDPRAYSNLRRILVAIPCENTLRDMLGENKVEEGFLPFVFQALKCTVADFDKWSKYVLLSWDAINFTPELYYVPQGEDGFLGGLDSKSGQPATQANVLMIRSIFGDFKLPVAYFLNDPSLNTEKVREQVEKAIDLVNETGLVVKGLVCDQFSAHQSLFNKVFKVNPEKPYFTREGSDEKIFCFFDPPHLLKSVKANLKKTIAVFVDENGVEQIASWKDIIDFYIHDTSKITRVAPKLTNAHIFGASVTNMNVPMAAQIFSRTVAGGIEHAVRIGVLQKEALGTAKLCRLFNDVFDTCNAKLPKRAASNGCFPTDGIRDFVPPPPPPDPTSCEEEQPQLVTRRPFKLAVTENSMHHELWDRAEKFIKSLKFLKKKDGKLIQPPCLHGWLLTISSFKQLWEEMHSKGCNSMPTGTINQDFVENFFSQVSDRILKMSPLFANISLIVVNVA
jgi:hypothetical protein